MAARSALWFQQMTLSLRHLVHAPSCVSFGARRSALVPTSSRRRSPPVLPLTTARSAQLLDAQEAYGADQIQVLEGLDPVRKRPGMYIGSTGTKGLHHLVWEIVDNSIDEVQGGHAAHISVVLDLDENWVTVRDDGRGIPTGRHSRTGRSALETVLTVLHAGGKFGGDGYAVSGGLHGVGLSVVNALSEQLEVSVWRGGTVTQQAFQRGKPVSDAEESAVDSVDAPESGTQIKFKYDATIFAPDARYDPETIQKRLRELAFLNNVVTINFSCLRDGALSAHTFHYQGGIREYAEHVTKGMGALHDAIHFSRASGTTVVEAALQWTNSTSDTHISFVNCIRTIDGGSHLDGLKLAVTRTVNKLAREKGLLKEGVPNLSGDYIREGLTAIISVKLANPEFEGQTKTRLGNPEVRNLASQLVGECLEDALRVDAPTLKVIVEKALLAQRAADAAKRARDMVRRKTVLARSTLPGKLADCTSSDSSSTEIFIVEGESAGGSAKQARDRVFQAILPLRGKILNVEKADDRKIYANKELSDLIVALGLKVRGDDVSEAVELANIRYGKIIILTDADVDGAHIRTLLLTFLFRYQRSLFEHNRIFVGMPPLYKVESGRKKVEYCYSDEQLQAITSNLKPGGHTIQRFKGLGEMMPEQLWETTMNPATRTLTRLTIDDALSAQETFAMLMGDNVDKRKQLIRDKGAEVAASIVI